MSDWLKTLYETFGVPYPILSLVIVIIVGGMFTGGAWLLLGKAYQKTLEPKSISVIEMGIGGPGGNALATGNNNTVIGGKGGDAGVAGRGGAGGGGEVTGDNSYVRGGDGGNAGQADGRGGRRTLGPTENMDYPTNTWNFGYGGAGANAPEYDRRLTLLIQIRKEYMDKFPEDIPFIESGIDPVPLRWVNKRLEELHESWRVEMSEGGYILPPI